MMALDIILDIIFVINQEKQYKQTSSVDQLAIHFALEGNLIHKDSDEARRQLNRMGAADGMILMCRTAIWLLNHTIMHKFIHAMSFNSKCVFSDSSNGDALAITIILTMRFERFIDIQGHESMEFHGYP